MSKQTKAAIISGFFVFLITTGFIEVALRIFDPLGLNYFSDLATLYSVWQSHETGYTFPDGEYRLSNYSFTYRDGQRVTPDSNPSGKQVVFIGDSVSFGLGVNDAETWINLVARELNINAINLALPGYNIGNIERQLAHLPPDSCIVWLVVGNDHEPDRDWTPPVAPKPQYAFITRYLMLLAPSLPDTPPTPQFYERVEAIAADERVTAVAFDAPYAERMPPTVHRIPPYQSRISYVDAHANEVGNQEIAVAIAPIISSVIRSKECH